MAHEESPKSLPTNINAPYDGVGGMPPASATHDQIPEGTMKMLTDEAWEVFKAEDRGHGNPVERDKKAFQMAAEHLITHALEEGIIITRKTSEPYVEIEWESMNG